MDNKNLIMGSVAIIVVVLFSIILFMPKGKSAQAIKLDTSKVKIYRHIEATKDEKGYYTECKVDTETLVKINEQFNKAYKINSDNFLTEKAINGDYKVVVDTDYLAFDKENNNMIYLGKYNKIYGFESTIYDLVINSCK